MRERSRVIAATTLMLAVAGLTGCAAGETQTVSGTIVELTHTPARDETVRRCNGAPVLLICSDEEVHRDAYYGVEAHFDTPARDDVYRCWFSTDAAEYDTLTEGAEVEVNWNAWSGCKGDFTLAAEGTE